MRWPVCMSLSPTCRDTESFRRVYPDRPPRQAWWDKGCRLVFRAFGRWRPLSRGTGVRWERGSGGEVSGRGAGGARVDRRSEDGRGDSRLAFERRHGPELAEHLERVPAVPSLADPAVDDPIDADPLDTDRAVAGLDPHQALLLRAL